MRKREIGLIAGLAILVLSLSLWSYQSNKSLAGGPFSNVTYYFTDSTTPYMNHAMSTTTQTNLAYVGTATSTEQFSTESVDQVNFNLFGAAATTTSLTAGSGFTGGSTSNSALSLSYCYQYSDDQTTWFDPSSNCDTWSPGTIATTTKEFAVSSVNAKYMRFQFSSPNSTSTRFGLWGFAELKKGY